MIKVGVVVVAFNRPVSLAATLKSIGVAHYPEVEVDLIISIDGGAELNSAVLAVAEGFDWILGRKTIIKHPANLGLRRHVIECGSLTSHYDGIIMLEDDIIVSKGYFNFAYKALSFYGKDKEIAGVSLYSYEYSEISRERFYPYDNNSFVYFMMWPSSWGQAWTRSQWNSFLEWYSCNKTKELTDPRIPKSVRKWPSASWKKYFVAYLVESNKYFVFPRHSFSTPSGINGVHVKKGTTPITQVALATERVGPFGFIEKEDQDSCYDSYFQPIMSMIQNLCPELRSYDFTVDLQGNKPLQEVRTQYLLSVKKCNDPIFSWGWDLFPIENNLFHATEGNDIYFGRKDDFLSSIEFTRIGYLLTWSKRLLSPKDLIKVFVSKSLYKAAMKYRR